MTLSTTGITTLVGALLGGLVERSVQSAAAFPANDPLRLTLNRQYPPATSAQNIAGLIRKSQKRVVSSHKDGAYIYCKPPKGEAVLPVIGFTICLAADLKREFRLRTLLLSNAAEGPRAFGYRMEAPEGAGAHDYYHCQLINSMTKDGTEFPGSNGKLPEKFPAFPIDAGSEVQLAIALCVALYGLPEAQQKIGALRGLGQKLLKSIEEPRRAGMWLRDAGENFRLS